MQSKPNLKEISGLLLTDELRKQYLRNIELMKELEIEMDKNSMLEYRIQKLELEIKNLKSLVISMDTAETKLLSTEDKTSLQSMYY